MGVPKICIVIAGNPLDGYTYYGPFTDETAAVAWAEGRYDDLWWVTELDVPRPLKRLPTQKRSKA